MRIYRISFLFRSPSVSWDYKSANDRDLAEDITKALEEALAPAKPISTLPPPSVQSSIRP